MAGQTDRWSRWHSVRDEGCALDRSTMSARLEEARDAILRAVEGVLNSAPTPVSPTLGEAVDRALEDAGDRSRFLAALTRAIQSDTASSRTPVAHVVAHKRP